MDNELMLYAQGLVKPPKQDRQVAELAKTYRDQTRAAAFRAQAHMALATSILDGLDELITYKNRKIQRDDIEAHLILDRVVGTAARRCIGEQENLFGGGWGF